MYPFIRFYKELWKAQRAPKMGLYDVHVTHHICWPWDLDPWMELNNGRTLTIYDLGRVPMAARLGLPKIMRAEKWGLTVAGNMTRYRRRVRMFDRVEMRTRIIGWDRLFIYIEQAMWKNDECLSHVLVRNAITSKAGIVSPRRLMEKLGHETTESPVLPEWVQTWIDADSKRAWPPHF